MMNTLLFSRMPTPEMEGEDKEFDAAIHNIE